MIIFGCQLIGLYTELFIVRKDGDGDVMDDSAGPARILLII